MSTQISRNFPWTSLIHRAAALLAALMVCRRSQSSDRAWACEICPGDMRRSTPVLSARLRPSPTAAPNKNHSSAKTNRQDSTAAFRDRANQRRGPNRVRILDAVQAQRLRQTLVV
jgi:hypothetical protein